MELISIIIPTYNRANIIVKTIESILNQTYQEWECIIVDDKSADNTLDVLSAYAKKDERIIAISNKRNKGAQGARNTGIETANGTWLYFFDSDNQMHPDCLEQLSKSISDEVDVCACDSKIIDIDSGDTGKIMHSNCDGNISDDIFTGRCYVDFNHAIIRKSKILEIGCLDEDVPSMQEWDTHIRLSKICKYKHIPSALIDYFVGGKDAISSNPKREVRGRLFILNKHIEDWKARPQAFIRFYKQIVRYIRKNTDKEFKKNAYKELYALAPKARLYDWIITIKSLLKIIIKK